MSRDKGEARTVHSSKALSWHGSFNVTSLRQCKCRDDERTDRAGVIATPTIGIAADGVDADADLLYTRWPCNAPTHLKSSPKKSFWCPGTSLVNAGQVRIWRLLGQGQGHRILSHYLQGWLNQTSSKTGWQRVWQTLVQPRVHLWIPCAGGLPSTGRQSC